jgi:hypothetical protein
MAHGAEPTLPDAVRASCARVVAAARDVAIDDAALARFATSFGGSFAAPEWSAGDFHFGDDVVTGGALTAQYILVLDALNFCFWPSATGTEYDALAAGLRDALRADARALDAGALARATAATVAGWVRAPHALPFLEERAARVREVGAVLGARFGGSALALVRSARGSAAALAALVAEAFPGFRDATVYVGADGAPAPVYFYKRAQIFAGDVWTAFGKGAPPAAAGAGAAFDDISALTAFADYRLPQLLRAVGALRYSAALGAAVDAREELTAGGAREVEIRAATVVAVERLRDLLAAAQPPGAPRLTAVEVDHALWHRGEAEAAAGALGEHHRVRTIFY